MSEPWNWVVGTTIATYIMGCYWFAVELINAPWMCDQCHFIPKEVKECPKGRELVLLN